MAALGIGISEREPETVHVSLPGRFNLIGQQKPAALIEAEIASDEAWKKYSQAVDDRIDGLIDQDEVDHLYCELVSIDAALRIEQSNWKHSFTLVPLHE